MKSTHFPLLRSSPAVGTGSYGALPSPGAGDISSYAASSLSASTASEEVDGRGHDNDDTGELVPPRLRERGKRKAASVQDDDTGFQNKSREASGASPLLGHLPDAESEYEHGEEGDEGNEDEEDDEDDNSP